MSKRATVDGNEAAASVAYRLSEAIAIYPITPSSPMAELCDEWASCGKTNIWSVVRRSPRCSRCLVRRYSRYQTGCQECDWNGLVEGRCVRQ